MIYLVEDDESIRELVVYTLNSQGMEAEGFGTPSDFWNALDNKIPDLILLDIMHASRRRRYGNFKEIKKKRRH